MEGGIAVKVSHEHRYSPMKVLDSSYSLDVSILWDSIYHSHTHTLGEGGYLRRVAKLKSCTFSLKSLQN